MSNPLYDVIPAAARKYVYALLAAVTIGLACYQAADGDWLQFVGLLVVSLTTATAASNTNPL